MTGYRAESRTGKGGGQLPGETKRLEKSVSFRCFCFISSDFVAGRSGFLITDATDLGWTCDRNRRLVYAGVALVAGGQRSVVGGRSTVTGEW